MPLADVLMLMTDCQAPGRVLVLVLALLGNSSSDMSFVLHSSSPTVHYSAASSRALALIITHTRHAASDWSSGLPGLVVRRYWFAPAQLPGWLAQLFTVRYISQAQCSHPWNSRLRAILVRMPGCQYQRDAFQTPLLMPALAPTHSNP
ncbi:hypothetical protein NA56DRAFT_703087 [Hyaloscypha hepaticicola]|uniref:Uncharacterized protein n=1 Tax=Hyaloscypha hepaticicola TaxID=2082293 RepID=A0A2J6Q758_9HELO|nr:hypothetical protein NA56DRAFT_703087 [Hyaloscypha hepaticicola]